MRRTTLRILALSVFAVGCGENPVANDVIPEDLLAVGFDATSATVANGFYWLPPTVKKASKNFGGTFDANLLAALQIEVCLGTPAVLCPSPLRTLSGSSQPEIIRIDLDKENYSVTWQSTNAIVPLGTHRAFVTATMPSGGIRTIGYLDLLAVDHRRDLKGPSNPSRIPGFVRGSPFVFKFRVEEGIPGELTVAPQTADIFDTDTPAQLQVFTATLTDLHGNPLAGSTIGWGASLPLVNLNPASGPTDAFGQHTTDATPTTTVAVDTDVNITATHDVLSDVAVLTVKPTPCTLSSTPDTDSDRLPDCVETNTGVFNGTLDTGTNPLQADTDGDGIDDGDEVLGTLAGLDLPGLGVSPVVPSILIEYDWFDDGSHTHRPTATQINMVTASFAAQGIEVIHDYGQGPAPFDRGNLIADADGNVDGFGAEFYGYKAANFDANRNGYFHFNLHPHRYNNGTSSGLAEINGDDLITATLTFYTNNLAVAGTIQHELGHNLGLRHGGFENRNRKPNYNSVMSYNYQFGGVDNDCDPDDDGVLDYSHGINPDLDENNLSEPNGICGPGFPFDWNQDGDGGTDVGIAVDINHSWNGAGPYPAGDGSFGLLRDYDDWSNLFYGGIGDADGAARAASPEVAVCQAPPADWR